MRLYFDCCCYNRPFDDLSQNRIHDESDAILSLLNRSQTSNNIILGSSVLKMEIDKINDPGKKFKVNALYQATSYFISYTSDIRKRAEELQRLAIIHQMDSLHIASAEAGNANIFLTTDDKLIKACRNIDLNVRVMNPVSYLAEVIEND